MRFHQSCRVTFEDESSWQRVSRVSQCEAAAADIRQPIKDSIRHCAIGFLWLCVLLKCHYTETEGKE